MPLSEKGSCRARFHDGSWKISRIERVGTRHRWCGGGDLEKRS
jgi:hypothetical protein